jgi:hypothetical protein
MINHNYLQVALFKNEIPKSIYEVKTGIACDCFCPICGNLLEAKNAGKEWDKPLKKGQKVAHFAHSDGSDCSGATESILHKIAKDVLEETLSLKLPVLHYKGVKLKDKMIFNFDSCVLEKIIKIDNTHIQPDAILVKDKTELYIEFYKTHLVDDSKIEKIKQLNNSTIEIDLNEIPVLKDGVLNKDEIRNNLINQDFNRYWLHNKQQELLYKKYLDKINDKDSDDSELGIDDDFFDNNNYNNNDLFDDKEESFNYGYLISQKAIDDKKLITWKKNLKQQGFRFLKLYKYQLWDYESKGHKSLIDTFENIYCPKLKNHESRKTIELLNCKQCEHHKSMMKNDTGDWCVACGF